MASGYTRQSAGVIVTGNTIQASDSNNEYDALLAAFDATSGHNHDGTVGGGAKISATALNGLTTLTTGIVVQTGASTFSPRTLTGTANRVTITNGTGVAGNPTIDIASTYVGQATITTLGTITTGVWTGTLIAAANGGTGVANSGTLTFSGTAAVTGTNTGDQTTITGNAGTATALQTPRLINGTSFNGTADITVTAAAGTLTGTTLNATVVTSSLTTVGTIGAGTWQGTVVAGQYGGTGVANTGRTITLGGNLTTSGAFATTITATGTTTVTLPTTGTLYGTAAGSITSAQLAASLTDETGTGVAVFSASPALTGVPTAPTAAPGTNTTQLATTAFVAANSGTVATGTWTPQLSFSVPGDLAVTYLLQAGSYVDTGTFVILTFNITTASLTHTTASGSLVISGQPFAALTAANTNWIGPVYIGGYTKAGFTAVTARLSSGASVMDFPASGSGAAPLVITAADTPSGGTVNISGTITYRRV